ncbi:beta-1,4-galactosyltransferase 3-like [Hyla sarda]|uniref:beta-1,4-galactosyltransferase 3-like n=1 Tax=Hyla sarda TaxID=327740 RepID=UPI0024C34E74|nr:beta-1,4-galactosyltransferase 3-like [Hyla sarda]XP_056415871.1 beta-1,4-galactosyltransferase 3-like [Hyla sarda]XP_056415872.1 beta-1,4-galactosyltransferase 3-like [Hyla sarda]XP_056415873.1 beta-1,4-galactosyltransferase 3-like [Hyla sarda]
MFLSRADKPCFFVCLAASQLIFILLLYRRGASSVFQGLFGPYPGWDYSKTQDVYTNLSLFVPDSEAVRTQYCPVSSPILVGPLTITFNKPRSLKSIQLKNRYVTSGGYFSPRHCFGRYRTAVIIPHRNRESHLRTLLYYLHPFLQRQQLHYAIFVVHQAGNATFNRAKLLNVGVREALRYDDWDCIILHDVDLVPENDCNLYICDEDYPKHLSSAMDKFQYSLPYWAYFGGVSAITPDQFMRINGFPNTYWGWGGEDDDIAMRIRLSGMSISRTPLSLGRYKMIPHDRDSGNEENSHRYNQLRKARTTWKEDGMNSLEFRLLSRERTQLYTNLSVDIGDAPEMPTEPNRWSIF